MTDIKLPPMPLAFFDEFGNGADDRVQDYAREAVRLNAQAVPDGWKLVPVQATPDMCRAAVIYANGNAVYKNVAHEALEIEESIYSEVYDAMLSAAPAAPAAPQPAQAEQADARDAMDAARWRYLAWHIGVAWNEQGFTSLVRIVSDKHREMLGDMVDRMMSGDLPEAAPQPAQAVPDGWVLVPVEPTPEMLAAGAVSVLPQASNDIELARSAAMIVLCKPDAPSGVPMELLAATIATMAPYYRSMLSAAPAAPQPAQQADKLVMCGYGDGGYACCEGGPCAAELHNNSVLQPEQQPLTVPDGFVVQTCPHCNETWLMEAQQPLTDEKDALLRQALDAPTGSTKGLTP